MRVGHTSPALIRSTYGHLIGTVGRRAAEATPALVLLKTKPSTSKSRKCKNRKRKGHNGSSGVLARVS